MEIATTAANNIRILSAAMVEQAKSGHPGGAMGGADFIQILYSEFLKFDPDNTHWIFRDRFFLDPGHMSPMLYAQLSLLGNYSMEDLKNFRQWGSITPGHPELDVDRGIENTSGPLGQGHVMAVGAAIAERFIAARFGTWTEHKTYAFISDGGIQEEISQGAGRIAGHLGLSNLIMFYDANDVQLSTNVDDVSSEDTLLKYQAWGWRVIPIVGNNPDEIRAALKVAIDEKDKPVLIIGKTIMGKGAVSADGQSFEGKYSTHGQPLSNAGACFKSTVKNLGGDENAPFRIIPEVQSYYNELLSLKRKAAANTQKEEKEWVKSNPELAEKLYKFFAGKCTAINYAEIEQKENIATRVASSKMLKEFAAKIDNMLVMSADLSNSDKTDGFLSATKPIVKNDFSGAFLHIGVSELTMACMANGMALHGGIIPVCGTFFVFSDYMKPAVRMAALMKLPVKYVWTHDSYRVGEDGPTHQPIEHEAQIRLMEELKNHSGERSLLVLRPADAAETTVAWEMAIQNISTPTALLLSRQNIDFLPYKDKSAYQAATQSKKGGRVVYGFNDIPAITFVASGSEVAICISVAKLLEEKEQLKVNVVALISSGLFLDQDNNYRDAVINKNSRIIGITTGLPSTLASVCPVSDVIGLNHFGYSAPATILDEKFGFTAESIYKKIIND